MAQFEAPAESVAAALSLAKATGRIDPAESGAGPRRGPEYAGQCRYPDAKRQRSAPFAGAAAGRGCRGDELARRLLDYGVGSVVITQGERGALLVDAEGVTQIPAVPIQAVDVTGAGDSFNAALAVSLGEGLGLAEAARVAVRAGAYTAMHPGVIGGLPTRAQLARFPRANADATT